MAVSPSERDRKKDWKARGRLNQRAERDLKRRLKRDENLRMRRDPRYRDQVLQERKRKREERKVQSGGCAVTALSAGAATLTLVARLRGWV